MVLKNNTKKIFCLTIIIVVLLLSIFFVSCSKKPIQYPKKDGYYRLEDIRIRDISVITYDNKYYMYGMYPCSKEDGGYACYVSEDLIYWKGPYDVFLKDWDDTFVGTSCFWAPEVHEYNNEFYLFGSYQSAKTNKRGTSIFKSSSPLGPFEEISDGHVTPHDWHAIDGTLYIDEDNQPWLAFVREWVGTDDQIGEMCVAKLSDDLTKMISEPKTIFRAKDPLWSNNKVTDAPYLYKTKDGELLMIWSNSDLLDNYAIGIAYSENGKIDGNWKHKALPLYSKNFKYGIDGGHGVIFKDLNGRLVLGLHTPGFVKKESDPLERAMFYLLEDTGKTIKIKQEYIAQ